jgi:hypothetical protein
MKMHRPLVSVVLATSAGREIQLERAMAAYVAESSEVQLDFVVRSGSDYRMAWADALRSACATADFIHLGSDELEPHPGWWRDAIAATNAGYIAAPVLWSPSGEIVRGDGLDWTEQPRSKFPFFARVDGLRNVESLLAPDQCILRSGYAFTWWRRATG